MGQLTNVVYVFAKLCFITEILLLCCYAERNNELGTLDCTQFGSRHRCENVADKACDWRKNELDDGYCENRFDTLYDGEMEPFMRKGGETELGVTWPFAKTDLDKCITPVISDLGKEPCY